MGSGEEETEPELYFEGFEQTRGVKKERISFKLLEEMLDDLRRIRNLRQYGGHEIEIERIEFALGRCYRIGLRSPVEFEPGKFGQWITIAGKDIDNKSYEDPDTPWIRG